MKFFKKILKKFLPSSVYKILSFCLINTVEYLKYNSLNHEETFKKIYFKKKWGNKNIHKFYSGDGSHISYIIRPYIKKITEFIKTLKKPIIIDAGCGDFNVGKNFVLYSKKYYAYDVFDEIIKLNKQKFNFKNLTFEKKNIVISKLPFCDILIIRQVLQHLSNTDIKMFLQNIHIKTKYLLVTEHYPSCYFKENKNKPKGEGLRYKSAVILHKKPFDLKYIYKKNILRVKAYPDKGYINSILYKLK